VKFQLSVALNAELAIAAFRNEAAVI